MEMMGAVSPSGAGSPNRDDVIASGHALDHGTLAGGSAPDNGHVQTNGAGRPSSAQRRRERLHEPPPVGKGDPRSVPLWVRFCDDLVADGANSNGLGPHATQNGQIDWRRVWDSARGLPLEHALGRAVILTQQATESPAARTSSASSAGGLPTSRGDLAALPPPPVAGTSAPLAHVGLAPPPPPVAGKSAPPADVGFAPPLPTAPASGMQGWRQAVPGPGDASSVVLLPPPPETEPAIVSIDTDDRAIAAAGRASHVGPETDGPETDEAETQLPAPSADTAAESAREAARNRRLRALFVGFGWVRNVGFVLLLFAAWQLWGTSIEQSHSQDALRQQFQAHVQHATTSTTAPSLVAANQHLPDPAEGSVVAHLQIPAIGVDQYVVEGTAEGDLAKGPGHYVGTSLPGQAGNVAIAGHRTTYGAPFNRLNELTINDRITLTTLSGEALTYTVSQPPDAVSPGEVSVLNTVSDNRLTLTTCTPKFSATQRLVVVALLRQPQAAAATTVTAPHAVHVVADSTGWNVVALPVALAALAGLVALALLNGRARRMYGRIGRVLVLGPMWVAGLYLLFEALTRLLPSNL